MDDVSRAVMTFLVNVAWQTLVFALVAVVCDRLLRRAPARYRHQIWMMALGLSLALPLWSVTTVAAGGSAPAICHAERRFHSEISSPADQIIPDRLVMAS